MDGFGFKGSLREPFIFKALCKVTGLIELLYSNVASTRHSEIAQTLPGIVDLFQIGNVSQGIIILFYFSHVMLCRNALGKKY